MYNFIVLILDFLKEQNLINVSTEGMTLTTEGELIIDKLKELIHEPLNDQIDLPYVFKRMLPEEVMIMQNNLTSTSTTFQKNEMTMMIAPYGQSNTDGVSQLYVEDQCWVVTIPSEIGEDWQIQSVLDASSGSMSRIP